MTSEQEIRVAISGDPHGQHDTVFETLRQYERANKVKIDVLICCGDYEPETAENTHCKLKIPSFHEMRNVADLEHFHAPIKYRQLRDFHKYYSGKRKAPCLSIFVGGNHENSAFHSELPHGGWVANNIYYMGFASVVNFGGLRIAGWSGIYNENDYNYTHFESPPFPDGQHISAYHVRAIEMFRLQLLATNEPNCVDVFVSHDWPGGVTKHGDEQQVYNKFVHYQQDIQNNRLGNPFSGQLLHDLRPRHWFAGHLHYKFEATVEHDQNGSKTEFLALDKCVPGQNREFFKVLTIKASNPLSKELRYDPKWLAILRKTAELETATRGTAKIPEKANDFCPTDDDLRQVEELFEGDLRVPHNFRMTAPPENLYKPKSNFIGAYYYRNPQTAEFCAKLKIPDLNEQICSSNQRVGVPQYLTGKR